jgi:hypothetical protein
MIRRNEQQQNKRKHVHREPAGLGCQEPLLPVEFLDILRAAQIPQGAKRRLTAVRTASLTIGCLTLLGIRCIKQPSKLIRTSTFRDHRLPG